MGDLSVTAARAILERHASPVRTFVETGTHDGITLWPIYESRLFDYVHSIELSPLYYQRAIARGRGLSGLQFYHGDSAVVLPALCRTIHAPVFYWLDAHWFPGTDADGSPCPLFAELDAIAARAHADVVVIDDVQCFGVKWSDGPGGDWTGITRDTILARLNGRVRDAYVTDYKLVVHLGARL